MNSRGGDGGSSDGESPLDPEEWDDPVPERIEPGRPDPENVAFVVLGALGAIYVIARAAGLV